MEQSIVELSGMGLTLVPVVVALTSIIKAWVSDNRLAPVVSIVLGVAGSVFLIPAELTTSIITGIIIGLTASGAYSGAKTVVAG